MIVKFHLKSPRLVRETNNFSQGLLGHRLKTFTSKEDHALPCIMRGGNISLSVRHCRGYDWANQVLRLFLHGAKTFSSCWILPKTSNQIPKTNS